MLGMKYIEEMIAMCGRWKNIYIFGAGKNGEAAYYFLRKRGIEVKGFIVSSMVGNLQYFLGKKVMDMDEYQDAEKGVIVVPMPRNANAYKQIFNMLVDRQISNVYYTPIDLLRMIQKERILQKNREIFNCGEYRFGEDLPVEAEHGILIQRGIKEEYHWRFPVCIADEPDVKSVRMIFGEQTALQEFEKCYGKYNVFMVEEPSTCSGGADDYAVYMACSHVDCQIAERKLPAWIIPIQVGAELTSADICKVKDNIGANISKKNGNYSECTAIYWMWKNAPEVEYIGLCHYRRHFNMEGAEIRGLVEQGIDVLLTSPAFVKETVGNFFSSLIPHSDLQVMVKVIEKIYPEYSLVAKFFLKNRFYPPCNLFIMKHGFFKEYAEFAFSVTFEIESFYDRLGFYRKDRYMGFIMECLLGIFVMKNKERFKVAYVDMKFFGKKDEG